MYSAGDSRYMRPAAAIYAQFNKAISLRAFAVFGTTSNSCVAVGQDSSLGMNLIGAPWRIAALHGPCR